MSLCPTPKIFMDMLSAVHAMAGRQRTRRDAGTVETATGPTRSRTSQETQAKRYTTGNNRRKGAVKQWAVVCLPSSGHVS